MFHRYTLATVCLEVSERTAGSVEEYFIDTKSAENRRKKRYQCFIISCQVSVKIGTFLLLIWRPMLWYRLSTDSRATRLVFLIFGVKSTFFSKSAKIKLKTNNFLIGIVRKDHTFLVVLPSQEGDSSTLTAG